MQRNKMNRRYRTHIAVGVGLILCIFVLGCQSKGRKISPDSQATTVTINEDKGVKVIDSQTARKMKMSSYKKYLATHPTSSVSESPAAENTDPIPVNPVDRSSAATTNIRQPDDINVIPASTVSISPPSLPEKIPVALPALTDPALADKLISIDFNEVDIRIVLDTIGDITGVNFIVDDKVKGPVTVISPTKIRVGDLYDFLESILAIKGYAAIPSETCVKIVPREKAVKNNLKVRRGIDPDKIPQDDSFVTQILPLRYAETTEVSNIIKPLLPATANMSVNSRTNSLIVTDTSANIYHIAVIIQQLDVPGAREESTVYRLKYASAQKMSQQISEIMNKKKSLSPRNVHTAGSQVKADLKILPDTRTNSLIIVANPRDTTEIIRIVKNLDVEQPRGATNAHVKYLKHAQAEDIAKSLTASWLNMQKNGSPDEYQKVLINADKGTNSLIVTASAQDYKIIESLIEQLDIVREQVLVEMLIMEVSDDILREIGVDWQTLDEAIADHLRAFGQTNFGVRVDHAAGNLEGLSVGAWKDIGGDQKLGAIISALEKQSGVNILSTPHILTSNHQDASIFVGDNIPYVEDSRITDTDPAEPTVIQTYKYKDVGVDLKITPHVSQGGLVRLEIKSKFTKLIENVTGLGPETPTIATRQAETVVTMKSGVSVVIGGLIRDDKVTLEKKIPFLGEIPWLGELFKYKRDQLQKTNLLLFITPHILASQEELVKITDQKKLQMDKYIEKNSLDSQP